MKIIRKEHLVQKIVFVDGLWGCGKTMISSIVADFDRVELLSYNYELEQICSLYSLKKISALEKVNMQLNQFLNRLNLKKISLTLKVR